METWTTLYVAYTHVFYLMYAMFCRLLIAEWV